jgi:threonine/homoserine/homoserine lactone efflux protein
VSDLAALFLIVGAIALGAMSPGPSVIYVSRMAAADSRRSALAAALGMGLGGVVFAIAATLGLGAVLHYAGWAFLGLKLAGGAYLLYLGIRMFVHAGGSAAEGAPISPLPARRALLGAALTQLSNPKAIVVYSSVFAALLPAQPPLWMLIVLPLAVFIVETSWYVIVALAFSTSRPRALYARFAKTIDRVAGTTLGALGTYFAIDAVRAALR